MTTNNKELREAIDYFKTMCFGILASRNMGAYNQEVFEKKIAKQEEELESYIQDRITEAETNAVAWSVGVIDDIHIGTAGLDPDRNFKTMKNTIRERYEAETGIDPAPNYPIKVKLQAQLEKRSV